MGWLWLTVGARTLTQEALGKYSSSSYYSFVSFCSVVGVIFIKTISFQCFYFYFIFVLLFFFPVLVLFFCLPFCFCFFGFIFNHLSWTWLVYFLLVCVCTCVVAVFCFAFAPCLGFCLSGFFSFLFFFSGSILHLVGSRFPGQGSVLGLQNGRTNSRILSCQRIPNPR